MQHESSSSRSLLEACVESLDEAIYAAHQGASRLELCADLHLDGTTPDVSLVRQVVTAVDIPVKVMIRPRGGDFVYSIEEIEQMLASIALCKVAGAAGIVTGALLEDYTLDIERLCLLAMRASPLPVTVHKCIDRVPDIFQALEILKAVPGITGILSSGQAETAMKGAEMLRRMRQACGDRLTLIVAGRVTPDHLPQLIQRTGAWEYHGRKIV